MSRSSATGGRGGLPIVSLRLRHGEKYLHHNYVVALLNDLFGIQARGGCSCAGPYGHRLLAIDPAHSQAYRDEIGHGCEGIKPGWVRINFNYFISDAVADYLTDAVALIATGGHRLLADYRFDPHTGLWRHRHAATGAPIRLADLHYTADGTLIGPARQPCAGEEVLGGYLRHAAVVIGDHADDIDDGPTGLPPDFEALRWFHLPPSCLAPAEPAPA
jgi:hypothetical protein